ncbi:MAG: HPr(Ser) kinase/phosphatase [Bacillota bacterium]|jgi:HPr kinase/phosphorylase|nr:HPr(Ser) kinase/phosphatase [Bacillota bacterium]HHU42763.1 HPr(Ser) kinase/phosphatase [Clostridiales bacterium]
MINEQSLKISEKQFAKECGFKIYYNAKTGLTLTSMHINRPGLMLAGHKEDFAAKRIQIMGKSEMGFLHTNDKYVDSFFASEIPCVVISYEAKPTKVMEDAAKKYKRSIFISKKPTSKVVEDLTLYLSNELAPTESVHGVLMDIFGIGVLLTGKSSIGKSETALELVHRGHRLVADDLVTLKRINDNIYGTSPNIIKHFMEIRGVGIIDIKAIYGEGSIIDRKKVELVIELEQWDDNKGYERIGNLDKDTQYLGIKIPKLFIPVHAGRNLAVVIEVAARDFKLKQGGYNPVLAVQKRMEREN